MDVVASIHHAIEITAKLRTLAKKVEDADFKMLLADLSNELADAKLDLANLKAEMASLKSENNELRSKIGAKEGVRPEFADGAYIFVGESGHFCTACFDTKSTKVRLTTLGAPFNDFGRWQCPSCQAILT